MAMINYKLNKIGRFINGANFTPDQLGSGTKFVNLDDVYREKDLKSSDTFEYVKLKNEETYLLQDGDILFVRSSVKPSGVGYPCIFNVDSEDKVVFCGFLIRFRFNQSNIFPKYLLYQLLLPENRNKVVARGQVVANTNINQRGIGSLSILLHESITEQTAIATILSKVDEAIESTQNSIKAAEKLKKALMQNLFTGKLKPDGTWRAEDEFYKDEKFGKVPKGWIYDKVKNLTNRVTDGEHLSPDFQDSGSYLLSAEDILDDGVSFSKAKFVKQNDCKKFRKRCDPEFGDVLIVSRGAGIGRTCKVSTSIEFCLMGSVILIKPNNEILHGGFLAQYFKSYQAWVELQKLSGTTAQQAIYLTHIKKVRLIYPENITEQELISTKLESFDIDIAEKQTKIQTLQRLKKTLMQNLLTGKVRLDVEAINKIISNQEL